MTVSSPLHIALHFVPFHWQASATSSGTSSDKLLFKVQRSKHDLSTWSGQSGRTEGRMYGGQGFLLFWFLFALIVTVFAWKPALYLTNLRLRYYPEIVTVNLSGWINGVFSYDKYFQHTYMYHHVQTIKQLSATVPWKRPCRKCYLQSDYM